MFHSEFSRQILIIGVLLLGLSLSSCSTMDSGSSKTQPSESNQTEDLKNNGADSSSQTDSQAGDSLNVAPVFTGVDPMADIQINAEIKKVYKEVANLSRAKKYTQAINLLNNLQSKYPQLSGSDYQKARIYFEQNKLDDALKAVESSLKNNQRNYYALNLKGIILREQGRFDEAREIYLIAIEIYPPYPNSHLNLGILADIYMRDLSLALIQYREYLSLLGNNDETVANWVLELERRIKNGG